MIKVIYKANEINIIKATVHRVRIFGGHIEVTFTDSKGHYWFETYNERQLEEFFKKVI